MITLQRKIQSKTHSVKLLNKILENKVDQSIYNLTW